MRMLSTLLMLLVSNLVWATPTELNHAEFKALGEKVILDVRSAEEFAEGHIPGAINMPFKQLTDYRQQLNKLNGKPIVVYCRSGRRAVIALDWLDQQGYAPLYHLDGDMLAWQEANLPVEK